jgi:hypothetical protein
VHDEGEAASARPTTSTGANRAERRARRKRS